MWRHERGDGKAPRGSRKAHGEAPKRLRSVLRRRAGQGACLASRVRAHRSRQGANRRRSCASLEASKTRRCSLGRGKTEKGRSSALCGRLSGCGATRGREQVRSEELGTLSCPYRFGCVRLLAQKSRILCPPRLRMDGRFRSDLPNMLMDARGEKRSHERLNEILNGALRACRKRSEKDACARN